jgi:twitching motility protein PilT
LPESLPNIDELLSWAVGANASDLHLKAGSKPAIRVDGELQTSSVRPLRPEDLDYYLASLIPERLEVPFKEKNEADFAYGDERIGRFRVNAFRQRGNVGIVIRALPTAGLSIAELGLPPVVDRLAREPRGLILVTGPTGSGKTTTLSAIIDAINSNQRVNIVTIEDPIEVLHGDKLSLVSQREVGVDTENFGEAMRRVLRQDPDVILVGEMRDMETIDACLTAAETGHLVLSTLHTLDATETVNRILDFFPAGLEKQVRLLLAGTLRGIVSQRLLRHADGAGRVPAVEVLVNTERAAERIANPELTSSLPEVVAEGSFYGMVTFDDWILQLLERGVVTFSEAMRNATNPTDFKVMAEQRGLVAT